MKIIFILKRLVRTVSSRVSGWFRLLDTNTRLLVSSVMLVFILASVGALTVGVGGSTRVAVAQAGVEVDMPLVSHKTLTLNEPIAFTSTTVADSSLAEGVTQVRTPGVDGVRVRTFDVTYENGRETSRTLVSEIVVQAPVQEIVAKGTSRGSDRKPYGDWGLPDCERKRGRLICTRD